MAKSLLEAYAKRLKVAEDFYAATHNGVKMDAGRKLATAKCIDNLNKFLNEALDNSVGVQRGDLGLYKKFSLNLTNVAIPSLIAFDLVMVSPMSSMSGYVSYLQYTAGSNKGDVKNGIDADGQRTGKPSVLNSPFGLKQEDNADGNYTSSKVTKTGAAVTDGAINLRWSPIVQGSIVLTDAADTTKKWIDVPNADGLSGKLVVLPAGTSIVEVVDRNGNIHTEYEDAEGNVWDPATGTAVANAVVKYGTTRDDRFNANKIPAGITGFSEANTVNISYTYNNIYIPQNDVPLLNAQMQAIPLMAKARRIAIYYSQVTAFQAKTDYGFDMQEKLAEQAVGQLQYEIDVEIVNMINEAAGEVNPALVWDKTPDLGVSKLEHYQGFAEVIGIAQQIMYDRTRRFAPNWMIIASDILPVLNLVNGFEAAPVTQVNGPYMAGTFGPLKVFVSPALAAGRFLVGVKGEDELSSVAIFAPYMPVVPTQLLGYADGGMSQGFSTLYDAKVLNPSLVVAGGVTGTNYGRKGTEAIPVFTAQA